MRKLQPLLMDMLQPEDLFQRILVVESPEYLPKLRERYPDSGIYAVTADEETAEKEEYKGLDVEWRFLEYREEPLPFPKEFFDGIVSDLTLEHVANPQDIAAGFSMFLKETGVWLTSFRNIRHWDILRQMMEGKYPGVVSRYYARHNFENLLYASFYKEVFMVPVIHEAPEEMLARLIRCGFDNDRDDLEAEFWLVRAARSMPELSLLKSMYTPEERGELSRLLHRIEYGIDTPGNVPAFWDLYDRMGLFPDYCAAFIHEAVVHRKGFYERLIAHSPGKERLLAELLAAAIGACMNEDDPPWLEDMLKRLGCPAKGTDQ